MSDTIAVDVQMALAPELTRWDARVLVALDRDRGMRLAQVARAVGIDPPLLWEELSAEAIAHNRRAIQGDRQRLDDLRLTLRGLEHLGHVTGRGGWWRAL